MLVQSVLEIFLKSRNLGANCFKKEKKTSDLHKLVLSCCANIWQNIFNRLNFKKLLNS